MLAKPGTRLIRSWQGKTYTVTIEESGYQYQGKAYRSLSEIARQITGTRWSGPLFFGLKATYILKSAPVEIKQESTGGKIARCLFAYCAGIEDKGNVSVQLVEVGSSKMMWAYSVNKQRGGSKNQQSMAEAIAKHLKEFLAHK